MVAPQFPAITTGKRIAECPARTRFARRIVELETRADVTCARRPTSTHSVATSWL